MTTQEIKSQFGTYNISIEKNKSISIVTKAQGWEMKKADADGNIIRTFAIGDTAEYDSYNLSYLGTIVSITEKTVTIQPQYDTRTRRLKLGEFAYRNYKFDLAETLASNLETSYTI